MELFIQGQLEFGDIIALLLPRSDNTFTLLYDILLYICFFLILIAMALQSDKQLFPTILLAITLACVVIAKLGYIDEQFFDVDQLPALLINIAVFVVPLIAGGMARKDGKKAQFPSYVAGFIGGVYFFMFWFFEQRGS